MAEAEQAALERLAQQLGRSPGTVLREGTYPQSRKCLEEVWIADLYREVGGVDDRIRIGRSENFSAVAASGRRSSSPSPLSGWIEVTRGRPVVSVPVLSNRTVSTPAIASIVAPCLTRQPESAALPIDATSAVGLRAPLRTVKRRSAS